VIANVNVNVDNPVIVAAGVNGKERMKWLSLV